MRQPHLYSAVFGLLKNTEGKFLLLQRQNSGYLDGRWTLPAGHVESGELASLSFEREMIEELGITVIDYQLLHTMHKIMNPREYYYLCFLVSDRQGTVTNLEPEVCTDLQRFDYDDLPEDVTPEAKRFLEAYHDNRIFSEMDLRNQ